MVASLQRAGKTAGRKFTIVASPQKANKTGLRQFMTVASLQQCSWKPPAASKFLQRGGLGEAHLDSECLRGSNDVSVPGQISAPFFPSETTSYGADPSGLRPVRRAEETC